MKALLLLLALVPGAAAEITTEGHLFIAFCDVASPRNGNVNRLIVSFEAVAVHRDESQAQQTSVLRQDFTNHPMPGTNENVGKLLDQGREAVELAGNPIGYTKIYIVAHPRSPECLAATGVTA